MKLGILGALAVAVLAGCGAGDARFVGKWRTEGVANEVKGDQPGDRLIRGFSAFAQAVGPQIEVKSDHRFTLIFLFTIEGTWRAEGDVIVCTPDHVSGIPIGDGKKGEKKDDDAKERQPFKLKMSSDGKSLRTVDVQDSDWTLTRVTP